ncbi:MAG: SseB family protein [Candidatus Caccovivens sp.]
MDNKKLTNAIIKLHNEKASQESIDNLMDTIKEMLLLDQKVYAATEWKENEGLEYKIIRLIAENKYFMIAYSGKEFFEEENEMQLTHINIQGLFSVFLDAYESNVCEGIIFNPKTEVELILRADRIFNLIAELQ